MTVKYEIWAKIYGGYSYEGGDVVGPFRSVGDVEVEYCRRSHADEGYYPLWGEISPLVVATEIYVCFHHGDDCDKLGDSVPNVDDIPADVLLGWDRREERFTEAHLDSESDLTAVKMFTERMTYTGREYVPEH